MVFRLKKKTISNIVLSLLLSLLFIYPWLMRDGVSIEHDTLFHLSRIQGLAESMSRGDWLPCIYPYKNNGFGYASPLFYCDLLLIPFAGLYLLGLPLSITYQSVIFCFTFLSAFFMMNLLQKVTKQNIIAFIVTIAYLFANYRITDTYVRSAFGEVMAMTFIPLLLLGIYEIEHHELKQARMHIIVAALGLVFSHNLTFMLGMGLLVLYTLINWKRWQTNQKKAIFVSLLITFLLSLWYTIPMIEQLSEQEYYVHYYASSSDLASSSMKIRQYFANTTVFGYSGNTRPKEEQMLLTPGYFLMFVPIIQLFLKEKSDRLTKQTYILGYLFLLLPCIYVPWKYLFFLRVLQFPWRLMTLALPLLAIATADTLAHLPFNRDGFVPVILSAVLLLEGMWHLYPVNSRTFLVTSQTQYSQLIDGSMINPYYSATYVRVELAGGDYLPSHSPDFREYSTSIKDEYGNDLDIPYTKNGTELTFTLKNYNSDTIQLPITWYKGYSLTHNQQEVEIFSTDRAILAFHPTGSGTYVLKYTGTFIQKICRGISLLTLLSIIAYTLKNRRNH